MSIQAVAWVLEHSESKGLARLVLISLANHANHDAECWPSQRTLAKEAGIGVGTVPHKLAGLVKLGELEVVAPGGFRKSTRYRMPYVRNAREMSAARDPGVSAARDPDASRTIKNRHENTSAQHASTCRCKGVGHLLNAAGDYIAECPGPLELVHSAFEESA